ncbi:hypothetical protein HOLleu_44575 [Holothuria leucospilota]|nr:hypothetical protein HOLleu_44575 [Holothuria leucospilota]
MAYRLLALWINHGEPLGKGNRIVLLSRCVWRIREEFPEEGAAYQGFKEVRHALD